MEFNTLFFIFVFLPVFIISVYLIKNNLIRNIIILLFSSVFIVFGDFNHVHIFILLFSFTYVFANLIERHKKLYWLYLVIVISMLAFFKYVPYVVESLKLYIQNPDWSKIIMPLGISFYTFTAIGYVSDVYFEKFNAEKNPFNLLVFLTFFPTFISGPLLRYNNFKPYLESKNINTDCISEGLRQFMIGLIQKVLLANQLALIATSIINDNVNMTMALSWYAFIAYGIQEFYDFNGYSMMAAGIGKMIGFDVPKNFDNPYCSHDVAEYWRRWHMTMGSFFKDYVFVPVSSSKWLRNISKKFSDKKTGRNFIKIVSLSLTWFLTGVWHGSSLNYIIWGLLNGLLIIVDSTTSVYDKLRQFFKFDTSKPLTKIFQVIRTILIIFAMKSFIFKCSNLNQVISLAKGLVGLNGFIGISYVRSLDVLYLLPYLLISIVFLFPYIQNLCIKLKESRFGYLFDVALVVLSAVSVAFIISGSYSAFLYFSF